MEKGAIVKRLWFLLTCLAAAAAFPVAGGAIAAPPTTCSAGVTIFTTSAGDVTVVGNTTHFRESGVGGRFTSGFLAGYTLTGAQNIQRNDAAGRAVLEGQFVATGPGGSVTVHYTGSVDLATGAATGHLTTVGGIGDFADFHWNADIDAQLVSLTPPTFVGTDSGFCHGA
jgi:hypothetical protein